MSRPAPKTGPERIAIAAAGFNRVGGIETYMRGLARGFAGAGSDVHCICTNYRGDGYCDPELNAQWHDLSTHRLTPWKPVAAAAMINRIAPSVLILNHCALMQYALPLLDKRIKPVVVLHSDDPQFYRTAACNSKYVFRWIAPTAGVAERFAKFVSHRSTAKRIAVIPHGIDQSIFHPRGRTRDTRRTIAFVGFIAPNKGADLLPDIIERVARRHGTVAASIVGYGPLQGQLEGEFARRSLGQCVRFTGKLTPSEVANVLRQADVFLLPTRIEGFGLVIAEAMMCGAVPVVTRLSGVTDQIVDDGRTGLLVDIDDVAGFIGAIDKLLADPAQLEELQRNAARAAVERFSLDNMVARYIDLFNAPSHATTGAPRGWLAWLSNMALEIIHERKARRALNAQEL